MVYEGPMKIFFATMFLASCPLWALDLDINTLSQVSRAEVVSETLLQGDAESSWYKIQMSNSIVGEWNIYLKKSHLSPRPQPVLFVAAGIQTGLDTLQLFDQKQNSHLVVFEYNFDKKAKDIQLLTSLLQNALKMQMQMALTLKWISQQSFVREDRINALLVSFGSFIAPMAVRTAQQMNVKIYSTVFAFGGARIKTFIEEYIQKSGNADPALLDLKKSADAFLDWMDPANHLPELRGQFLIIRGAYDHLIPALSADTLIERTPEPKKVVVLPTEHIDLDRKDIVRQTMQVIQQWYGEISAFQ